MPNDFDELPKRPKNHVTEEQALSAFKALLVQSEAFIIQSTDINDYGVDCQIEVIDQDQATNVRTQVQIKGTAQKSNLDGSISVSVNRTTLNYLLAQPHSFFVCFHVPTRTLRFRYAEDVLRQYAHTGESWVKQKTLTVVFSELLTVERLDSLASLTRSDVTHFRDERTKQISASTVEIAKTINDTIPHVHVPENRAKAIQILDELYQKDYNEIISAAFDKFIAVIGSNDDASAPCYMAEINLGMDSRSQLPERIEKAIEFFQLRITAANYLTGSIHYSIGNAYSALGDEERAKNSYINALADNRLTSELSLKAQVYKNLGSSIEKLGEFEEASEYYLKAIELSPNLPEAHYALGNYYIRVGRFADALEHFDKIIFDEHHQNKTSAISGWRINALFNLEEGRAAFREINTLLSYADSEPWIWPWCARQVASFGRASVENAKRALHFWQRFVDAQPDAIAAKRELLLVLFYLRSNGEYINFTYSEFCSEFDMHISSIEKEDAAFLWDRLGHWAQDEENWEEAERCFQKAYDMAGEDYGYCLGTALNFLTKFEDSLPILLNQAETIQPDAMSWFQVAVAQEGLGNTSEAIDAYKKALSLDPDYDHAIFNLGGIYWNSGNLEKAKYTWNEARQKFPDHELTAKLNKDFKSLFKDQ